MTAEDRDMGQLEDKLGSLRAEVGAEPWERPIPIGVARQLPPFPLVSLPTWLSQFVAAVAEATQTPPDLAGMLALDVLAACAGGRVRLEVRPGWEEPLNLYTLVALPPGERKSGVFEAMTAPLAEWEAAWASEMSVEVADARARRRVAEKALESAQNAAAKARGAERERQLAEVSEAAREVEDIVVPADFRLLADDATPETISTLLAEQRGRLAVLSPEGGVFGQMAGRYSGNSGQPNLDVYLKGHSGDMLRVDRKSRASEYVRRPALTVGLAVQPDVLRSLAGQPGFRGRGLLARFLYSLPASLVGSRRTDVAPLAREVQDAYAAELRTLAASLESIALPPHMLRLSRAAEAELLGFADQLEPRLGEDGDLSHVADWGCKLTGAVARLAGLLHLADNVRRAWAEPVAAEQARAAIALGRYLIPHAIAAFDLMEADPNLGLARRVLRWIIERNVREFSRRDCFRALAGRVVRVESVDPVLSVLEGHGFIRRRPAGARAVGRPAGPAFNVNPLMTKATQLTKPGPEGSFVSSGGFVIRNPETLPEAVQPPARDPGDGDGWERLA